MYTEFFFRVDHKMIIDTLNTHEIAEFDHSKHMDELEFWNKQNHMACATECKTTCVTIFCDDNKKLLVPQLKKKKQTFFTRIKQFILHKRTRSQIKR